MLQEAGIAARVHPSDLDDGRLQHQAVSPIIWVMALAYFKARRVVDTLHNSGSPQGTVLGADTVCVHDGRIFGQPPDEETARSMISQMRNRTHQTITGVCLMSLENTDKSVQRRIFYDRAIVTIGSLSDQEIHQYVSSGQWKGKAGGYNLSERVDAGWPIQCEGDPTTVMGLPMQRLMRDILPPECLQ